MMSRMNTQRFSGAAFDLSFVCERCGKRRMMNNHDMYTDTGEVCSRCVTDEDRAMANQVIARLIAAQPKTAP